MTRYDAIVVGARVAGSATARCLARRGYRVLLVDKAHFPSDTISSHLVKARAIAYLDRWGLRPALVAQETDFRTAFSFTCEGLAVRGHATGQALRRTLAREHGSVVGIDHEHDAVTMTNDRPPTVAADRRSGDV